MNADDDVAGVAHSIVRAVEEIMVITLEPELEAALREKARRGGIGVEILVLDTLRQRFLPPIQPRDEWERQLLAAATPCGVSVSDEALSREAMYE